MTEYHIKTDAVDWTIEASDADEAARIYAADEGISGINTLDDLVSRLDKMGGWLYLDGRCLTEAAPDA